MRKKQGILVISDGLGDRPNPELNGLTPLEYAGTPNLDKMTLEGMCGNVYPISPGISVGTDVGHLEIFGCNSKEVYPGRGPLEAISCGLVLKNGDIAFRGNFGTIKEDTTVIDRRAGRIRENTKELAAALDGMVLSDGTIATVKELTEHRVAVVLRGDNMSENITCTDPGTACEGEKLVVPYVDDHEDLESIKTAKNLWEFTMKSYEILKDHSVNKQRVEKGELPANVIITRGPGKNKDIPSITKKYGIKGACIAGDQTVGGIGKLVGLDYYVEDSFTGGFDTNMIEKAKKAIQLIESGYDWVVIHIKGTDLAGHDNLPKKKVEIIEKIDHMIGFLMEQIDSSKCYINMTADHSTPCEVKDHTGDGVPTIIWGSDVRRDTVKLAGETYFTCGGLNNLTANDIFMMQMDLMGFIKKMGA